MKKIFQLFILALLLSCSEKRLGSHFNAISSSQSTVALVSTSAEPLTAFESAQEAVNMGAKILLYPEWGYLPSAVELSAENYQKWKNFAQQHNVYIVLGARFARRNSVFVFQPNGAVPYAVRRDGNNSPIPVLDAEKKALILDTPYGKFGVLVCDESRLNAFLVELKDQNLDALLVPNYIGATIDSVSLLKRYANFGFNINRFNADRLPQFGGNETHVYRKSGKIEFNSFGVDLAVGTRPEIKVDAQGLSYSISFHELGGA